MRPSKRAIYLSIRYLGKTPRVVNAFQCISASKQSLRVPSVTTLLIECRREDVHENAVLFFSELSNNAKMRETLKIDNDNYVVYRHDCANTFSQQAWLNCWKDSSRPFFEAKFIKLHLLLKLSNLRFSPTKISRSSFPQIVSLWMIEKFENFPVIDDNCRCISRSGWLWRGSSCSRQP